MHINDHADAKYNYEMLAASICMHCSLVDRLHAAHIVLIVLFTLLIYCTRYIIALIALFILLIMCMWCIKYLIVYALHTLFVYAMLE